MADAREKLRSLAKDNRHKNVSIKVPEQASKPLPPKKVKRSGPTRPYHQAEPASDGRVGAHSTDWTAPVAREDYEGTCEIAPEGFGNGNPVGPATSASLLNELPLNTASQAPVNEIDSPTDQLKTSANPRYKPSTVGKNRGLSVPQAEVDLGRDDDFIEQFLMSKLGPREFGLYRCYRGIYARARSLKQRTLFFKRPELERLLGSNSSATVTRTLRKGIAMGFFEVQTFGLKIGDVMAGTYIHIVTPWVNTD